MKGFNKKEQYVTLPAQPQNKYTPYYESYGQQKNGNIAEKPSILTSYNQITRQTNNYDLIFSNPAVLATYHANQIVSNARPVPIYDANAVGAAQRANYAIQQRQFDNNVQSGVNYLMTNQIQAVEQTTKPKINQLNFRGVLSNQPGMIANSVYSDVNPEASGLLIRTPKGRVIGQQPHKYYNQAPTYEEVASPDKELQEYVIEPEMYKYLSGFAKLKGKNLDSPEMYEKVIGNIIFDTYGISKNRIQRYVNMLIAKYKIQATQFIRDYLESVVIGKLNGLDITNVWNNNDFYIEIDMDMKQRLKKAIAQILATKNLASQL